LETLSSHFLYHRHDSEKCDMIICLEKDEEIPNVKIVEINQFNYESYTEGKIGVSISIDEEVYDRFLEKVFEDKGRTHGGAISETVQELMIRYCEEA